MFLNQNSKRFNQKSVFFNQKRDYLVAGTYVFMAIIIHGVQQTPIGLDDFLIKCPSCETFSWADVMVISRYFYIYFIPIFPIEKDANIICKTCGLKRYKMPFDKDLISNYDEIKRNYRHPWFTYMGLSVIILIIVSIIIGAIF